MTAIVSLKSDQSPSALNPTTVSAADSSAPAVLRQAPTDEVPYKSYYPSHRGYLLPTTQQPSIFLAAQRGDVNLIRQLIESGRARASDRDDQNVTPLHWAAINAQLPACRYLLEQGAEVDALGGDLVATPMQWAARNGYLYVIQLLIAHGADPNIKDTQGYNTLHLVTHSSSIMPLLYLLHQPISIDERDSAGHTALMWAAYQGDALSVETLLKHGANPNTHDDSGLTPLHWAVVRGNKVCILKLFEKGAEIHAKDNEGRTARDMAVELKSLGAWKRALEEGGFTEDGSRRKRPLSEVGVHILYEANLLALTPTSFPEEYQAGCIFPAHDISLPDVYYAHRPSVVHGHDSCHGRVLWLAPRRYLAPHAWQRSSFSHRLLPAFY